MAEAWQAHGFDTQADDGHRWQVFARVPAQPRASLLWLPALGVAAKHYLPFAEALAAGGIAVFVHEWRGNGSSNLRPGRRDDWGYHELLTRDLPASEALLEQQAPGLPRIVGGHSLGGQLACCHLALSPERARQLWLVASGAPYWRAFPLPHRLWLPLAYRFLPWLAQRRGSLPGRHIGFGGEEARGLIRDWARTGLSGRYRAAGLKIDLEAAMGALVDLDVRAVAMQRDWLGPESSLRFLLSKLRHARATVDILDSTQLGTRADHFAWMKQPETVAATLLR
ncbi:alpha/beta fold hydrolase [Lysobacter cavernae]|uniref:Alpha/beta fold hydrolase n=1 Tax=Lysobacter cavernae TaxID=1685901 RepID=A0ABV7RKC1_9GAMM